MFLVNMNRHPYSKSALPKEPPVETSTNGFRFGLRAKRSAKAIDPDQMPAVHLRALLDLITPLAGGREVDIEHGLDATREPQIQEYELQEREVHFQLGEQAGVEVEPPLEADFAL